MPSSASPTIRNSRRPWRRSTRTTIGWSRRSSSSRRLPRLRSRRISAARSISRCCAPPGSRTRLAGAGIGDDTRSLAVLLAIIRAMDAAGIQTKSDILFVGDVGEEGLGDLRGMKTLFLKGPYKDRIKTFISMDGAGGGEDITNGAVGSKRYRATFKGPGGHSYGAFGIVNPAF